MAGGSSGGKKSSRRNLRSVCCFSAWGEGAAVLGHIAHAQRNVHWVGVDGFAEEGDRPRGGAQEIRHLFDEGALACAVVPWQAENFARLHVKTDVVVGGTLLSGVGFGEGADGVDGHLDCQWNVAGGKQIRACGESYSLTGGCQPIWTQRRRALTISR